MDLLLLKSKRVLMGLYQIELAKEIGISYKSYNLKENGKSLFTIEEILKIIEYMELTFDEANAIFFSNKLPKC